MKFLSDWLASAEKKSEALNVQKQPLIIMGEENSPIGQIKVDAAYHISGQIVLAGWSTAKVDLSLMLGGTALSTREMHIARPDVAAHYSLPSEEEIGFILVADTEDSRQVELTWDEGVNGQRRRALLELTSVDSLEGFDKGAFGTAFSLLSQGFLHAAAVEHSDAAPLGLGGENQETSKMSSVVAADQDSESMIESLSILDWKAKKKTIDIQKQPLTIKGYDDLPVGQVKIDAAYYINGKIILSGWKTAKVRLSLMQEDSVLSISEVRVPRPDVVAHLSLTTNEDIGFVLIAEAANEHKVKLAWDGAAPGGKAHALLELSKVGSLKEIDKSAVGPAFSLVRRRFLNDELDDLGKKSSHGEHFAGVACPNARGYLEAASCLRDGSGGVVVGWLLCAPDATVWLEDEEGNTFSMDSAFRLFRQDVLDAVGADVSEGMPESGFILRIGGAKPGGRLRLLAASNRGIHMLGEVAISELPADPAGAAKWLFTVQTPLAELPRRFAQVDRPLIEHLIQRKQSGWARLPERVHRLGHAIEQPLVSIIIPLYGRIDFVEHQMVEFASDSWLAKHAEIIYVVDDPALVEPFTMQAPALHRLYKIPFTWIWGSANRGFSGANNLGAKYARAPYLNFLNSDAFPQQEGWLKQLLDTLASREDIGVIAPRLVFADGSIQHAGMNFQRRDELDIWINHHPSMGTDPLLDPHRELTMLPAVTGACMLLRTRDFDKVGRWDTGYLIGDFEDSDLCLKLRRAGLLAAYLPTVQLTHLERQSFKLIGQGDFRTKVVIYNAARHQDRWSELIEASASTHSA